jgi:hypothetical protein
MQPFWYGVGVALVAAIAGSVALLVMNKNNNDKERSKVDEENKKKNTKNNETQPNSQANGISHTPNEVQTPEKSTPKTTDSSKQVCFQKYCSSFQFISVLDHYFSFDFEFKSFQIHI